MTIYYVDPAAGSDANSGTSPGAGAWETLSKASTESANFLAGDTLNLADGTHRGELVMGASGTAISPIYIRSTSGRAVINGCKELSGTWTTASGAWSIANTQATNCVAMACEEGYRLVDAVDLATCQATSGTFFQGSALLYVHASDDTDPNSNGKLYEAPLAEHCYRTDYNDYIDCEGVDFRQGFVGETGYGNTWISGTGHRIADFTTSVTYRHAFQFADAYDCVAEDFTATDSPGRALGIYARNSTCERCVYRRGIVSNSSGYIVVHGNSYLVIDCHAYQLTMLTDGGLRGDIPLQTLGHVNIYEATNCSVGGTLTGTAPGNAPIVFLGGTNDTTINCGISGLTFDADSITEQNIDNVWSPVAGTGSTDAFVHNCVFKGTNARWSVRAYGDINTKITVSNSVFQDNQKIFSEAVLGQITSNNNNVNGYLAEFANSGGVTQNTLADWQGTTGQDLQTTELDATLGAAPEYRPSNVALEGAGVDWWSAMGFGAPYDVYGVRFFATPSLGSSELAVAAPAVLSAGVYDPSAFSCDVSCTSDTATGTIYYLVKDTAFSGSETSQALEIVTNGVALAGTLTPSDIAAGLSTQTPYYIGWVQET